MSTLLGSGTGRGREGGPLRGTRKRRKEGRGRCSFRWNAWNSCRARRSVGRSVGGQVTYVRQISDACQGRQRGRGGDRVTCSTAARREGGGRPEKDLRTICVRRRLSERGGERAGTTHAGVKPEFFSAGNAVSRPFTSLSVRHAHEQAIMNSAHLAAFDLR